MAFIAFALGLSWWWRPRQAAGPAAWIMIVAFASLGGIAFWFVEGAIPEEAHMVFIHWKPTVLYWTLTVILLVVPFLGWDYPARWVFASSLPLANKQWFWLNQILAVLYAILGGINLLVVYYLGDQDWISFKEGCYMNLIIILLVRLNFVWLPIFKDITVFLYRFVNRFI